MTSDGKLEIYELPRLELIASEDVVDDEKIWCVRLGHIP